MTIIESRLRELEELYEDQVRSDGCKQLFKDICVRSIRKEVTVARQPSNRNRNRYIDILPYDATRVKLDNTHDNQDYINANYLECDIEGVCHLPRRYILAQGPLSHTCSHFWLMIWQQNTKCIVMLNRIFESNVHKCEQYWPDSPFNQQQFVMLSVDLALSFVSRKHARGFSVTQLLLQQTSTGESRDIFHYQFLDWPDFGVPESPADLLTFLHVLRCHGRLDDVHSPCVIHCSAGVGRSGTFCLIDFYLLMMENESENSADDDTDLLLDAGSALSVNDLLIHMRSYRMGLVQTAEQLCFCYKAIICGAHSLLSHNALSDRRAEDIVIYEDDAVPESNNGCTPPPPPTRTDSLRKRTIPRNKGEREEQCFEPSPKTFSQTTNQEDPVSGDGPFKINSTLRRSNEQQQALKQRVSEMKQKQRNHELWRKRKHILTSACLLCAGITGCYYFLRYTFKF